MGGVGDQDEVVLRGGNTNGGVGTWRRNVASSISVEAIGAMNSDRGTYGAPMRTAFPSAVQATSPNRSNVPSYTRMSRVSGHTTTTRCGSGGNGSSLGSSRNDLDGGRASVAPVAADAFPSGETSPRGCQWSISGTSSVQSSLRASVRMNRAVGGGSSSSHLASTLRLA